MRRQSRPTHIHHRITPHPPSHHPPPPLLSPQSARDEALRVSREARDLARSLEELTEDAARGRVGEAVAEKEAGQAAAACDRWEQQLKRAEGKVDAGVAGEGGWGMGGWQVAGYG